MVLLPEGVGEKGFLESRSSTFRIDSSRKDMRRTGYEGPDWRQRFFSVGRLTHVQSAEERVAVNWRARCYLSTNYEDRTWFIDPHLEVRTAILHK
ncbi:hypothetical protein TNCV_3110251 [Trichonephila clavipes]|nr:hypothetical protein TNCV_3110251 [Trichonephila clavipes]